uniref:Olfactory receptor n=1 Tax=Glyphodes pyloalis TaxID=1242752 RepID=A0A6M3GXG0_GLYPY|nr:olfactory receptor [Glyphodes pyloalis]
MRKKNTSLNSHNITAKDTYQTKTKMHFSKDHPMSLKHIVTLRKFLSTCGTWPTEFFNPKSRRKLLTALLILISCTNQSAELHYISKKIHVLPFFDLGDLYMTFFLSFLTVVRTILPYFHSYGVLIRDFIMEFHLMHFRSNGEHYELLFNKINKFSHVYTYLIVGNMILGPIFFNIPPFYNNLMNGAFTNNRVENYTLEFSVYFSYPWYDEEDHFILSTIINCYFSYNCSLFLCLIDLLMGLMVFQIIGHIKTLVQDLRSLPRPKNPNVMEVLCRKTNVHTNLLVYSYDTNENEFIRGKIIEFVQHHRIIVRLVRTSYLRQRMVADLYFVC